MTVRDFVMMSLGEIVLLLAFSTGILVGISLARKESRHGSDQGKNEDQGRADVSGR